MEFASPLLIGELIRRNARAVPGRAAASLGDRVLSHAELDEAANRVGWALRELGVGAGDRLVAWADTSLGPGQPRSTRHGVAFHGAHATASATPL